MPPRGLRGIPTGIRHRLRRDACVHIKDNAIEAVDFLIFDPGPFWEHLHVADDALKEATQDLLASSDDTRCTADLTVALADALTKVNRSS